MSASFKLPSIVALTLLLGWGAVKVGWETQIEGGQTAIRYHQFLFHAGPSAGDRLGQGATLALLGGFRAVVANYVWLEVTEAWERHEWVRLKTLVDLVTTLQPRSPLFWEMGAWHLAWNASADELNNIAELSSARRSLNAQQWVEQGRQLLIHGVENIPERYDLWFQLGWLEDQKLHHYRAAAQDYEEALRRPGAPRYLERFVGYDLEKAGATEEAYQWWRTLWFSTTDRSDPTRAWDKVAYHLKIIAAHLHENPHR